MLTILVKDFISFSVRVSVRVLIKYEDMQVLLRNDLVAGCTERADQKRYFLLLQSIALTLDENHGILSRDN